MTWRIWLEAVPGHSGRFGSLPPLQAGWYGGTSTSINQPMYMRTANKDQAVVFNQNQRMAVIQKILDWRRLGYPCRAEPPIHLEI